MLEVVCTALTVIMTLSTIGYNLYKYFVVVEPRDKIVVIGVIKPPIDSQIPVISKLKELRRIRHSKAVFLLGRHFSYLLRVCDFVVFDGIKDDPKFINSKEINNFLEAL